MDIQQYLEESSNLLSEAARSLGTRQVEDAVEVIVVALRAGHPLLVCGNGGSAADAMHITGELVGRFLAERQALNCVCLSSNPAVLTAWANDYSYDTVFSRQVEAYGRRGGVLLGISTSGNSLNVVSAFEVGRHLGMATVGLTGSSGGKLAELSDVLIDVPTSVTHLVQQVHVCVYHYLCMQVEDRLL